MLIARGACSCHVCLQEEQVRSHEARLRAVSSELAELLSCPPQNKLKGRQLDQYQQKDQYLHFEVRVETITGRGGKKITLTGVV